MSKLSKKNINITIIGLGYVGLPLAIEFGKKYNTIGYDIDTKRIEELKYGFDKTRESSNVEIKKSIKLNFTSQEKEISFSNVYIITVPTPIKKNKSPDLSLLIKATKCVSQYILEGDIIVYESTVFPGATEDICVPLIEKISGLIYNENFFCGYSPERINPGDKLHRLKNIPKLVSASNSKTLKKLKELYSSIIESKIYTTSSIKVAEAAKVIENSQRDLNVAFVNELSIIFNKIGIDTKDVLDAAGTKWNFLPFTPGLVGGHCIGVDPYYLTYKASLVGHKSKVILSGRSVNNSISSYICSSFLKTAKEKTILKKRMKILIMGFTFKQNCPDIRNTQIFNIYKSLQKKGHKVNVYDPWVNEEEIKSLYKIKTIKVLEENTYDGVIIAVNHKKFYEMGIKKIRNLCKIKNVIYDVKSIFPKKATDIRL